MTKSHNYLNLQGYSAGERNEVIDALKTTISRCDGYIIDFKMFSDLALAMNIEIPENKILDLYKGLQKIIKISGIEPERKIIQSEKDCTVLMNVSFSKGTGDMKIEVPDVPG